MDWPQAILQRSVVHWKHVAESHLFAVLHLLLVEEVFQRRLALGPRIGRWVESLSLNCTPSGSQILGWSYSLSLISSPPEFRLNPTIASKIFLHNLLDVLMIVLLANVLILVLTWNLIQALELLFVENGLFIIRILTRILHSLYLLLGILRIP